MELCALHRVSMIGYVRAGLRNTPCLLAVSRIVEPNCLPTSVLTREHPAGVVVLEGRFFGSGNQCRVSAAVRRRRPKHISIGVIAAMDVVSGIESRIGAARVDRKLNAQ